MSVEWIAKGTVRTVGGCIQIVRWRGYTAVVVLTILEKTVTLLVFQRVIGWLKDLAPINLIVAQWELHNCQKKGIKVERYRLLALTISSISWTRLTSQSPRGWLKDSASSNFGYSNKLLEVRRQQTYIRSGSKMMLTISFISLTRPTFQSPIGWLNNFVFLNLMMHDDIWIVRNMLEMSSSR